MTMKAGKPNFYQIRNMPKTLRKAVKVAAALEGIPIWKWIVKELTKSVTRVGVIIEEGD